MPSSPSFVIQIARLNIEVYGRDDDASACLNDLKRVFLHHIVKRHTVAGHRIIVCTPGSFRISSDAILQWVSPCLGVAGSVSRYKSLFCRLFTHNKEIPRYSGTCNVICYRDQYRHIDYYMPENLIWRIEHKANEHVTYVYSDGRDEISDGLPSMLLNIIGSQYGYYLLFASCVAIEGEALLFTGHSGVGKTSLCMELIKNGLTYIGDDLVLLYRDKDRVMIGSLLFPLKTYDSVFGLHKKRIDVASQSSERPLFNAHLKAVYYLKRQSDSVAESIIEPMQGAEALEKMLMFSNRANTVFDGQLFVDTLSFVCSSVPCYTLSLGSPDRITPALF